jgi:hypothetical protein
MVSRIIRRMKRKIKEIMKEKIKIIIIVLVKIKVSIIKELELQWVIFTVPIQFLKIGEMN